MEGIVRIEDERAVEGENATIENLGLVAELGEGCDADLLDSYGGADGLLALSAP